MKKYISEHSKVDNEKEQYLLDDYNPSAIQKITETQHKIVEFQKKKKQHHLFSILICIDDFAEDVRFMKYSQNLHGLKTTIMRLLQ